MGTRENAGTIVKPWNFTWVIPRQLCAMAWPDTPSQLQFLVREGVVHLITLSREKMSPVHTCATLQHVLIDIEEFEPPSLNQINKFIAVCQLAREKNEPVGVHCRMGRGRTGVMLACYLVKFCDQLPEQAVMNVRLMRPASVETYSQEKAVRAYFDQLRAP